MNKTIKKSGLLMILLSLLLCISFVLSACGDSSPTVSSISVSTMPTKVVYEVGETLDLTGGELTVTYSDDSTQKVALTADGVTTTKPNMSSTGEKTISVTYQSKTTTFKITVTAAGIKVSFDLNYTGAPAADVVKVGENGKVSAPTTAPTRSGYVFLGWYVAADSESKFNFDNTVTENTVVYARWSVAYTVKFNNNFTGAAAAKEETVVSGEKVAKPTDPTGNTGNIFGGWYTSSACNQIFDFNAAITADTELFAGWVSSSATTYTFTIHYNYSDGSDVTNSVKVAENTTLVKPTDPTFPGSTFNSWCTDAEGSTAYTFGQVTANTDIYAKWNVSEYVVNYYYNHANNSSIAATYTADASGAGQRFSTVVGSQPRPELDGYYLYGWYTEATCENQFTDMTTRITKSWNLYARWVKENVFEAEYTELEGKLAFGYSDNGDGPLVLVKHNAQEGFVSSNGHWVASLHYQGSFLEFKVTSDKAVTDAVLVLRLSADFFDIVLDSSNYEISVNGTPLAYSPINLEGAVSGDKGGLTTKRPFSNHEITLTLTLKQGENIIKLTSLDSKKYGDVGTINATAPMVDCIYINTDAVLTWNPKTENVAD